MAKRVSIHPHRKKVLFLFLDGVGIGKKDAAANPFFAVSRPAFSPILNGTIPSLRNAHYSSRTATLQPLNATLGVPGLPQSGTGQTALLTGINAARYLGRHFGPYPYSTLRPLIEAENIFRKLASAGKKPYYANAFPQRYFDYITERPARMGAVASAWVKSGYSLNTAETLKTGKAVSADLTAERWPQMGHAGVPVLTPAKAGASFARLAGEYDLSFFEYYFTDKAGHDQSMETAITVLTQIDDMVSGIVDTMDMESTLLLITSDHGNMEDLSTKSHTRNPVPLIGIGAGHERVGLCRRLTDVAGMVMEYL